MRKRIVDLIEKMAAGCFVGAIIQAKGVPLAWAIFLVGLCLILQWRMDK